MKHIAIISSSVRNGRLSHRVALYIEKFINDNGYATTQMLDLKAYDFPLFDERLMFQNDPADSVLDFADKFRAADGIIIVSPVYNASFPAALKNVADLLVNEWVRKPLAISTVTYGSNQAISTFGELSALFIKLGALVAPVPYMPTQTGTAFDEQGTPAEPEKAAKYAKPMIEELAWLIDKTKG